MKNRRTKRAAGSVDMAYKIVLYPTKEQKDLIARTLGCCRYVYNHALAERKELYEKEKKSLTYEKQSRHLTVWKQQEETKWLQEVDATALQHSLRNLQDAYDNFFLGLKEHRNVGFPKFRSKHVNEESYRSTCVNNNIRIIDGTHIQLPKLGIIKCKIPRIPEGRILSVTVTKKADGRYLASVQCEAPKPAEQEKTGSYVGVDLGIKNLAVTSNGEIFDNPKTYEKNKKRLIRLQRQLSRKQKGSNNREKQRKKLAKQHDRVRNQRNDAAHKMTHKLVTENDVICIEDLDVKEMKKNRKLSRAVSDAALGEIRRQLIYKCNWYGKTLVIVDRFYPSSQTCSRCGHVNTKVKDLSVRMWTCPECGEVHDRDINAAKNILMEGMRMLS